MLMATFCLKHIGLFTELEFLLIFYSSFTVISMRTKLTHNGHIKRHKMGFYSEFDAYYITNLYCCVTKVQQTSRYITLA